MGEDRTLLQQSLQGGAPMEAATGEDTGTTVVHDPLNLRGHLASGDWSRTPLYIRRASLANPSQTLRVMLQL